MRIKIPKRPADILHANDSAVHTLLNNGYDMFGIPLEVIVTLASSFASWWMKKKAQDAADLAAERKAWIQKTRRMDDSFDAAQKRGTPWLRKFVAVVVIGVSFVGIFTMAFFPEIPVSIIEEVPKSSFLWGLIEWGSGFERNLDKYSAIQTSPCYSR